MKSTASVSFGGYNHGQQIGINYGSIHAEFYAPEQPETPPSPLSTVPFPRDPDFVRRDTLLAHIHRKCSVPGSRIALVGLGGIGKSQLAIEYSYRLRSESPATWVFWVHASNEARFEQSFRDVADQIKLPGRRDPKANIFQLVQNWLQDEKKGKWLCVLDNVDDEFLCSFSAGEKDDPTKGPTNALTKPLLEYVPRSPNGATIITSRSSEVALRMVGHKDIIEVKPMERSEALDLLQKKLEQPEDDRESRQLVDDLEFMPLAIVQAASYIRNRAPRCSVAQYLSEFRKSDLKAIKLLRKEVGYVYRDWEAKNSILVTWQISFDYLRQEKPSAADLLSLMSFFDRQGIPESLVRHQPKASHLLSLDPLNDPSDGETSESDIGPEFEDDVTTLRNYSFISLSEDSTMFIMHRLVQLSMRAWLKSHGRVEHWREIFIGNLYSEFPTGHHENWGQCRLLYPHVRCAMSHQPEATATLLKLASLLYRGAWYALESGTIRSLSEMASKSRKYRLGLLGSDNIATLESTRILAMAYRFEGRWEEAEQLQVQVMDTCKSKLGEDHPYTARSIHELAVTYMYQSRWKEAEQLNVQVTEINKSKLGDDDPQTLTSMHNLASTYQEQGRSEEAKQLLIQVLETLKTKFGEDHPDVLTSMNELAMVYWKQSRWKEAEQVLVQVMETRKTKLGEDHPSTLGSMHNLALSYIYQDRWEEADPLLTLVSKAHKARFGEDHPDTLLIMHNRAASYMHEGRWEEAGQLLTHVMETRKAKLGDDHPDTLTSMSNLAVTWNHLGHHTEAIDLLRKCLAKQEQILGSNHQHTLLNSLALRVWEMERLNIT